VNPHHLANWTVTHVDWLDGKWHPKSYAAQDVTQTTLAAIQARSLFQSSKCSTVVQSLTLQAVDFLAGKKSNNTMFMEWGTPTLLSVC